MYNVVQESMSAGVLFRAVTGSIFEAEDNSVEGVAVFIPCGLTGIRCDAERYLMPFGDPLKQDKGIAIYRKAALCRNFTVLCDWNYTHKRYSVSSLSELVDSALNLFGEMNVRRIAMNGIRLECQNNGNISESFVMRTAMAWCSLHDRTFEQIDFVDMRGGFGRIPLICASFC